MKLICVCSLFSLTLSQVWNQILPAPSSVPVERYEHSLTWISNKGLIVFAGQTITSTEGLNDIWSFNITTRKWTSISTANTPTARYRHSAVRIANDEILFFGGTTGTTTNKNFKFSVQSRNWTTLTPCPDSMNAHASVFDSVGNQMIVYYSGILYAYSISNNAWSTIAQGFTTPPNRFDPALVIKQATREVYLFGGSSLSTDIWKYDIDTNTWIQINPSSGALPAGRNRHCMVQTSRDDLVVFGGDGITGDTWLFDMQNYVWTQLITTSAPSSRGFHRCDVDDQDNMYVFGGYFPTFNDLWKLEVSIMAYLGKHKNIATLYGYTEKPYAIVMKYYPMGSLREWIFSTKTTKTVAQIFYFLLDIAQGVEFIWQKGFCHADLKPPNILIEFDASKNLAFCVLTDFGITQIFSDKSLLVQAFKPVTINAASIMYAAPEALLKLHRKERVAAEYLPKLDVYSFAIILFELVCRKKPF